jgi:hypothetical protein
MPKDLIHRCSNGGHQANGIERGMTNRSLLMLLVAVSACDEKKPAPPPMPEKPAEMKTVKMNVAETKPAEPEAKPAGDLKEVDLSVWGPAWKGYVLMAPAGAKATFDDPSRQLTLSETDYLKLSEAPFFEDGVGSLEKDKDNKNIAKVSTAEVTYERTPPLGKQWCFDMLYVKEKEKWSCSAETFTSAEMSKQLRDVCKSIKKK